MQQAQTINSQHLQPATSSQGQPAHISRLSVHALLPPSTDSRTILQRADETSAILRMLGEAQTSTVVIAGDAGAGKSVLAALVFRQLQVGVSPVQHFAWLTLAPNATFPHSLPALLRTL